jgi:hypothetical protein
VVIEMQVEGSTIPESVAVEGAMPEAWMPEGAAPGLEAPVAPEITKEIHVDVLPESSMDVIVRSPEIQDAEPIRLAAMSETATTSRDRLELLADDLVDPATVGRNLESMRHAKQWMKVRCSTLSSRVPRSIKYSILIAFLCKMHGEVPTQI